MARQRVAAYAVMTRLRDDRQEILLCRLAPKVTHRETWHLPGGGVDFGEDPADAVVREVREETGLEVSVGPIAHLESVITGQKRSPRHALRLYYNATLADPANAEPIVQEIDGSTVDARWFAVDAVRAGNIRLSGAAQYAFDQLEPARVQRVAAYGVAVRDGRILLTQLSERAHLPGAWTLPGGGVEHGERPESTVVREVREETGLEGVVRGLLGIHSVHLTGTAPHGRVEDFHGIQLMYTLEVGTQAPHVTETQGTTSDAQWIAIEDVDSGAVATLEVVRVALRDVRRDSSDH